MTDFCVAKAPIAFGRVEGRGAQLFALETEILRAQITDFGAALVSLEAPDRHGRHAHVVLGFDDVANYAAPTGSFGALLGRVANRLAGGRIVIDGKVYELSRNEKDATLHGGVTGFGKQFWRVETADAAEVTLTLVSPDGDQGFPGEVEARASYRLRGAELRLAVEARTTKPTPMSLSAHPYFNLDGPAARDCLDHRVTILAAEYLPTDERQIPTGERRVVADTPFDFTTPRAIGSRIRDNDAQLRYGRGYDHYFILTEDGAGTLRLAAGGGRRERARPRDPHHPAWRAIL